MASGPAVGKGAAFANWMKEKVDRKVAAIDMETSGVYDAAHIYTSNPRVIAIRGISDFADERKNIFEDITKNKLRSISIKNALSLFIRSIDAGFFKEDSSNSENKNEQIISHVKYIFVIGGITEESDDPESELPRLHKACIDLGRAIAKGHSQLIICSPFAESADYYTAMGYSEVATQGVIHFHSPNHPDVAERRKKLEKTLGNNEVKIVDWLYPGPENGSAWSQAWLLAQLQALEKADAIVAIGGKLSKTANTLLHLAEVRHLPIIPFVFLGGAAKRSFERMDWKRLHPSFDISKLQHESNVKDVIEIVNHLMADLAVEHSGISNPTTFFISRASQDAKMANILSEHLKKKGLTIILGDEEVKADKMAIASIDQALIKSDIVIVLWSKYYALSPWCYDELSLACNANKGIWLFGLDATLMIPQKARKLKMLLINNPNDLIKIAEELISKTSV